MASEYHDSTPMAGHATSNSHQYSDYDYCQSVSPPNMNSYSSHHDSVTHGPPSTSATSPKMSTLSPSAPSEQSYVGEKKGNRHFSEGSEVGYTELTNPVPEVVPNHGDHDKEAYRRSVHSSGVVAGMNGQQYEPVYDPEQARKRRICGLTRPVFVVAAIIAAIIVLALALGLGLGLGLNRGSSSPASPSGPSNPSTSQIGGNVNPAFFSRSGAFNGSGMALASANDGVSSSISIFYQKYTGEIIQLYYDEQGNWHQVTTITNNARNATPISAVAYVYQSIATTHMFYIDRNNYIRQKTATNQTQGQQNIWYDGPLDSLNLQTYNDSGSLVGLQACYWGNYYGSSTNFNSTGYGSTSAPRTGMNLWYARDESTFVQYDWTNGASGWNQSHVFPNMNTHAGVACQSWLDNTTTYLGMVDQTNTLRLMWRDTDLNKTNTTTHPINVWSNTSVSIPDIYPSSSLGYTDYLLYQADDGLIKGVNVDFAAENTTIKHLSGGSPTATNPNNYDQWSIDDDWAGTLGTHMAITGLDQTSGGRIVQVFYQSISSNDGGDGFTVGVRDSSANGGWSYSSVPVNITI